MARFAEILGEGSVWWACSLETVDQSSARLSGIAGPRLLSTTCPGQSTSEIVQPMKSCS